jgi:hypothetical protein
MERRPEDSQTPGAAEPDGVGNEGTALDPARTDSAVGSLQPRDLPRPDELCSKTVSAPSAQPEAGEGGRTKSVLNGSSTCEPKTPSASARTSTNGAAQALDPARRGPERGPDNRI